MKFNKVTIPPLSAQITLGLERGYTQELILKKEVITFLQAYQKEVFTKNNIALSASVSEYEIVFGGQIEPHLKINFINYPKFPVDEKLLKETIEDLTKALMREFHQNRVVIEYLDETIMYEINDEIDSRIKK